jgi:hypothetical protein
MQVVHALHPADPVAPLGRVLLSLALRLRTLLLVLVTLLLPLLLLIAVLAGRNVLKALIVVLHHGVVNVDQRVENQQTSQISDFRKTVADRSSIDSAPKEWDEVNSDECKAQIKEKFNLKIEKEFNNKEDLKDIVDTSLSIANDLKKIKKFIVPCFPPKYNILSYFNDIYIEKIFFYLQNFFDEEKLRSNPGDLIILARWLDSFEGLLSELGIDITSRVSVFYHINFRKLNITCIYSTNT